MLVNATVVHDNNRIGGREWLHFVQGTLNELIEGICVKRTLDDVTVNHTVTERQSRKDGESNQRFALVNTGNGES